MFRIETGKTCRRIVSAAILATLSTAAADAALAHGEKAQEAYLRMRGVQWLDTAIGPTKVAVNDEVVVTGRFMPSSAWPNHIPAPDIAFLNIGVPGPTFVRLESEVNGVNMVNSTAFQRGGMYEYKVVLKARRPGRYHIHPLVNVYNAGPMIGPGVWVEVEGRLADFHHEVTTLTGETVNLETHNLGTIYSWHLLWAALGVSWLAYWIFFKGRQLMPRYRMVRKLGVDADDMISPGDRKLALAVFVGVLGLVAVGFFTANARYPVTIPLQTGRVSVDPLPQPPPMVEVHLDNATYEIPGRSLSLTMTVKNLVGTPVQVGEFATATVRFINSDVLDVKPIDEGDLVASHGLRVPDGTIAPGETRQITLYASDAMWETQRLSRLIYDPDSRFGGLVHFYDANGNRSVVEVNGPLLPTFESAAR